MELFVRILTLPLRAVDFFFQAIQNRIGVQKMGYLFVLPNLLIFAVFIILPMLLNFYYGFTSGSSILPEQRTFVGAQNLTRLLTCDNYSNILSCQEDLFWRGSANTVKFVAVEVIAIIGFSLLTALALNRNIRGRGFFRSVFFYPVLLSPVVVALIWKWMLQDRTGVINSLIAAAGGQRTAFLIDANWAGFWVVVISVWAQMGFYTLILLAGLQAIPSDLYEAASMDGAGEFARLRRVTMPLLAPTMLVVVVLSVIRAVQVFDVAYVLTGGGPGTATFYLVQFIYKTAFDERRFGVAAGASLLLAGVLLVFTVVQLRLRRGSLTAS